MFARPAPLLAGAEAAGDPIAVTVVPEVAYLGETGTEAAAGVFTVSVSGGEVDRA